MEVVSVPWAALVAIGLAVTAVVGALWAKIAQVEKEKKESIAEIEKEKKEWIERWAAEAGRNDEPPEWDEKTDLRNRRDEIKKEKRKRHEQHRQELDERLEAYNHDDSTPSKFRNSR